MAIAANLSKEGSKPYKKFIESNEQIIKGKEKVDNKKAMQNLEKEFGM